MKILSTVLLIALGCTACAQQSPFVRVFDLAGKKIGKGHVIGVTDTSLQLKAKTTPLNIPVQSIGSIKMKRSAGNHVLVSSVICTTAGAVLGAITLPSDEFFDFTAGEGAAIGAVIGLAVGAAIGGITIIGYNPNTYLIHGDLLKWKAFQSSTSE